MFEPGSHNEKGKKIIWAPDLKSLTMVYRKSATDIDMENPHRWPTMIFITYIFQTLTFSWWHQEMSAVPILV